jgi:DNA-binding Lrp family transcriptional regulator
MNATYTPLEFRLLNEYQHGFPLVSEPFAAMAAELGCDESTVLATLAGMRRQGVVSRVGAVFAPRRVGASTLAALCAPPERLERIAAQVNARPEVNHNYQREHRYNLWFVATAANEAALACALESIAQETGCAVISLPMLEEFHIDLGFDLNGCGARRRAGSVCTPRRMPAPEEIRLVAALQPGFDLVARPFAQLAQKADMTEADVLRHLSTWLDDGMVKRLGVVVRHHELGYTANAMVVFDVPDAEVGAVGARLAHESGVTLCYRRQRHAPEWRYNLFCMVHGRARAEVEPIIARLCAVAGYPCATLFSTRRFKQRGAHYFDALEPA